MELSILIWRISLYFVMKYFIVHWYEAFLSILIWKIFSNMKWSVPAQFEVSYSMWIWSSSQCLNLKYVTVFWYTAFQHKMKYFLVLWYESFQHKVKHFTVLWYEAFQYQIKYFIVLWYEAFQHKMKYFWATISVSLASYLRPCIKSRRIQQVRMFLFNHRRIQQPMLSILV